MLKTKIKYWLKSKTVKMTQKLTPGPGFIKIKCFDFKIMWLLSVNVFVSKTTLYL